MRGHSILQRITSCLTVISFITSTLWASTSQAQSISVLPPVGSSISLSESFRPAVISGLTIHPDNPLKFDFLVDSGDSGLQGEALQQEAQRMINYFLTTITVPDEEMWVNLSPYEKNRIIADGLGQTEMGRDMLIQDYFLKQLTASLMYPEGEAGKKFWEAVYGQWYMAYGDNQSDSSTYHMPNADDLIQTFNKVWIVPESASVYVHDNNVFVASSHLKVMLEEDYLASGISHVASGEDPNANGQMSNAKQMIRDIILPVIEEEVNHGKTFANLRQIYNSMLLATWYKRNLKESLLGQVYMDGNKIEGIGIVRHREKIQGIYEQYVESFKVGVNDMIREEYDPATQTIIPKRYFSGGLDRLKGDIDLASMAPDVDVDFAVLVELKASSADQAMMEGTLGALLSYFSYKVRNFSLWKEKGFDWRESGELVSVSSEEEIEEEIYNYESFLNNLKERQSFYLFFKENVLWGVFKSIFVAFFAAGSIYLLSSYGWVTCLIYFLGMFLGNLFSTLLLGYRKDDAVKYAREDLKKYERIISFLNELKKHAESINQQFLLNKNDPIFMAWLSDQEKDQHLNWVWRVQNSPQSISIYQRDRFNREFVRRPRYSFVFPDNHTLGIVSILEENLDADKRLIGDGISWVSPEQTVFLQLRQEGKTAWMGYATLVNEIMFGSALDNKGEHIVEVGDQKFRVIVRKDITADAKLKIRDLLIEALKGRLSQDPSSAVLEEILELKDNVLELKPFEQMMLFRGKTMDDSAMLGKVARFTDDEAAPVWLKDKHPSKLFHNYEHTMDVAWLAEMFAKLRGLGGDEAKFLYQVGLLHDFDPNRTENTPASVKRTIKLLDRDFQEIESLTGASSESLLKELFGWGEKEYLMARVIILRTDYPFDEEDISEYRKTLQEIREKHSDVLEFVMREAALFSEYADKSNAFLLGGFDHAAERVTLLWQEVPGHFGVSLEEFLSTNYKTFISKLGKAESFTFDREMAVEFGHEDIEFPLMEDVLSVLSEYSKHFRANVAAFQALEAYDPMEKNFDQVMEIAKSVFVEVYGDKAMVNSADVGGIDLNANKLKLDEQGDKIRFDFSSADFDPAQMQNIRGLKPVIINIVPVTPMMLNRLLGKADSTDENQSLSFERQMQFKEVEQPV